jgi:hypothetical protein
MFGPTFQLVGRHVGRHVISTGVTIVKGAAVSYGTRRLLTRLDDASASRPRNSKAEK